MNADNTAENLQPDDDETMTENQQPKVPVTHEPRPLQAKRFPPVGCPVTFHHHGSDHGPAAAIVTSLPSASGALDLIVFEKLRLPYVQAAIAFIEYGDVEGDEKHDFCTHIVE